MPPALMGTPDLDQGDDPEDDREDRGEGYEEEEPTRDDPMERKSPPLETDTMWSRRA